MRAGGLARDFMLCGLWFAARCDSHFGSVFNGLEGTGDDHFSLVSAVLASADLLERFLGDGFRHFQSPWYNFDLP
jgi:hypothetical protein